MALGVYEFKEDISPHHKYVLDVLGGYMKFSRNIMNLMKYVTFIIHLSTI